MHLNDPVRTVRLYGQLGAKFGRVHQLAVKTPAEAVQALCAMKPGFEQYLADSHKRNIGYGVFLGKKGLEVNELNYPCGDEDIRIAPITLGAKKQGWVQIIVGIVLVIVGTYTSWAGGAGMVTAGWGMIVGGLVQLLMPVPKARKPDERADDDPSKGFSGPLNTEAQGHPVPVLYGRLIVGSAVISAGITTADNSTGWTNGSMGGGGVLSGGDNWLKTHVNITQR